MPREFITKALATVLIVVIATAGSAQEGPNPSKGTEAVKSKIASLAPHSQISVIPQIGSEEFGEVLSSNEVEFTLHDVDLNKDVTFKYSDVRKVRKGYGGYNSLRGKHTDRKKGLIITVCVLGAIGAVIAAAASARD